MKPAQILPIISERTAHLFIDSAIRKPTPILFKTDHYNNTDNLTNFIKPGKIDNYLAICQQPGRYWPGTVEINVETLRIESFIFTALNDEGEITVYKTDAAKVPFERVDSWTYQAKGMLEVKGPGLIDPICQMDVSGESPKKVLFCVTYRRDIHSLKIDSFPDEGNPAFDGYNKEEFPEGTWLLGIHIHAEITDINRQPV